MAVAPQVAGPVASTVDQRGRALRDLRISVTDRCNLRCRYCMPAEVFGPGYRFTPTRNLLTPGQIGVLASAFVELGVRRVRLTGGEPLLRRELPAIVREVAALAVDDIALTTNGVLLRRHAERLHRAGVTRVTVSLDTLDPETFRRISDVRVPLGAVLDGIDAAAEAGFAPLKLNCVLRRGVNDHEIVPLVRYARERGHIMRFIEYMDVGTTNGWHHGDMVPSSEVIDRIAAHWAIEPVPSAHDAETARRWAFSDGVGEIGLISSVTQPFCGGCTRARLSADGRVYTCLFAADGIDVGALLRDGASHDEVLAVLQKMWNRRTDRYSELRGSAVPLRRIEMSYIGG